MKGKLYRGERVQFGQKVLFRAPGKLRGGDLGARWGTGVWLGKSRRADEHVLADSATATIRARAIRSLPESAAGTQRQ